MLREEIANILNCKLPSAGTLSEIYFAFLYYQSQDGTISLQDVFCELSDEHRKLLGNIAVEVAHSLKDSDGFSMYRGFGLVWTWEKGGDDPFVPIAFVFDLVDCYESTL